MIIFIKLKHTYKKYKNLSKIYLRKNWPRLASHLSTETKKWFN